MLFFKNRAFREWEIKLIKNFLNRLIGESKSECREKTRNEGFEFLDSWDNRLGFVKETGEKFLILSLKFNELKCESYQLITRQHGEKWIEGRVINYEDVQNKKL